MVRCHMLAPKLMALLGVWCSVVYQLAAEYYTEFQTPHVPCFESCLALHDGGSTGCRISFVEESVGSKVNKEVPLRFLPPFFLKKVFTWVPSLRGGL